MRASGDAVPGLMAQQRVAGENEDSASPGSRAGLARIFGAGLITGAADDDPSGIVTYSQAGAQFGFLLNWTMLVSLPLLAAVQQIAARVGRTTGRGIVANMRGRLPTSLLVMTVLLLVTANTINLGADLSAMGEVAALVLGGPPHPYVIGFGLFCAGTQIFIHYARYVRVLRWLTLSLFAYVGTALVIDVPWIEVVRRSLVPSLTLRSDYLLAVVAILGTTIGPYLIFWQAAEEVEDLSLDDGAPLLTSAAPARRELRRIALDTWLGIGFSNLVGLFIIVAAAATLHRAGEQTIASAAQAAQALRPIAGSFATTMFAAGIVGTGLLAVPVLAGSAAYGVGEALGQPVGLGRRPKQARTFYSVIALATMIGTGLHFTALDPMRALFWSSVINGVLVVPILIVLLLVACDEKLMGPLRLRGPLLWLGWGTVTLMVTATATTGLLWLTGRA